ncbi:MAG: hypothetical protein R6W88_02995 [Desulfobacterales bacterium]
MKDIVRQIRSIIDSVEPRLSQLIMKKRDLNLARTNGQKKKF